MANLNVLKGKLTEHDKTYRNCATVLGISTTAFCEKMNGKSKFKVEEAQKLSEFISLSEEERINIFLK